jgi:hypothetical protein
VIYFESVDIRGKAVHVRIILLLAFASMVISLPSGRADGPPQQWELYQNDPNPFCGVTVISFAAPQAADVSLLIWNSDSSEVVRTLFEGFAQAGYYSILWDQLDDGGFAVPSGDYPYQLVASDPDTGGVIFEAWLTATVECEPTPALRRSWGRIKGLYR